MLLDFLESRARVLDVSPVQKTFNPPTYPIKERDISFISTLNFLPCRPWSVLGKPTYSKCVAIAWANPGLITSALPLPVWSVTKPTILCFTLTPPLPMVASYQQPPTFGNLIMLSRAPTLFASSLPAGPPLTPLQSQALTLGLFPSPLFMKER